MSHGERQKWLEIDDTWPLTFRAIFVFFQLRRIFRMTLPSNFIFSIEIYLQHIISNSRFSFNVMGSRQGHGSEKSGGAQVCAPFGHTLIQPASMWAHLATVYVHGFCNYTWTRLCKRADLQEMPQPPTFVRHFVLRRFYTLPEPCEKLLHSL